MSRLTRMLVLTAAVVMIAIAIIFAGGESASRLRADMLKKELDGTVLVSEEERTVSAPEIGTDDFPVTDDGPKALLLSAEDRTESDTLLDALRAEGVVLLEQKRTLESQLLASTEAIAAHELAIDKLEIGLAGLLDQRRALNLGAIQEEPEQSDTEADAGEATEVDAGAEAEAKAEAQASANEAAESKTPDQIHSELVASYTAQRKQLDEKRRKLLLDRGHKRFLEAQLEHTLLQVETNSRRLNLQTDFVLEMESVEIRHGLPQEAAPPKAKN